MNRPRRTSRMYAERYGRRDFGARKQKRELAQLEHVRREAMRRTRQVEVVSVQREFLEAKNRKELKKMAKASGQRTLFRSTEKLRRSLAR